MGWRPSNLTISYGGNLTSQGIQGSTPFSLTITHSIRTRRKSNKYILSALSSLKGDSLFTDCCLEIIVFALNFGSKNLKLKFSERNKEKFKSYTVVQTRILTRLRSKILSLNVVRMLCVMVKHNFLILCSYIGLLRQLSTISTRFL